MNTFLTESAGLHPVAGAAEGLSILLRVDPSGRAASLQSGKRVGNMGGAPPVRWGIYP